MVQMHQLHKLWSISIWKWYRLDACTKRIQRDSLAVLCKMVLLIDMLGRSSALSSWVNQRIKHHDGIMTSSHRSEPPYSLNLFVLRSCWFRIASSLERLHFKLSNHKKCKIMSNQREHFWGSGLQLSIQVDHAWPKAAENWCQKQDLLHVKKPVQGSGPMTWLQVLLSMVEDR